MPLLQQWVQQRPWLAAGMITAASGLTGGIATGIAAATLIGAVAYGGVKTKTNSSDEHPFRERILKTLDENPGLCYRELQTKLASANGTLRHHLDVLQGHSKITVLPINGRTCYFKGTESKIFESESIVNPQRIAESMPIGLSLVQSQIVKSIVADGPPASQSELGRRLGRTRATIHSAVKVLQRRGILREDAIDLSPHLSDDPRWISAQKSDFSHE